MLIAPQNSPVTAALPANFLALQQEIALAARAAHRTDDSVTLVAVSKGHTDDVIGAVAALGQVHFGESYLQEALPKLEQLRPLGLRWHFIGRIQANKSAAIAERFDWVHGVDRLKIAERLSAQRPHYAPPLQVCIQVNIAGDAAKAGVTPAGAIELAHALSTLPRLKLRGLMCILPAGGSAPANRQAFQALAQLLAAINAAGGTLTGGALDTLSMGMSADYREAIQEGATLIRIGTALFGPRASARLG